MSSECFILLVAASILLIGVIVGFVCERFKNNSKHAFYAYLTACALLSSKPLIEAANSIIQGWRDIPGILIYLGSNVFYAIAFSLMIFPGYRLGAFVKQKCILKTH